MQRPAKANSNILSTSLLGYQYELTFNRDVKVKPFEIGLSLEFQNDTIGESSLLIF